MSAEVVRLPFEPRPHQRDAHAMRRRFSVLVWHRRAGKTVFAIVELLLAALVFQRERGRFGYVCPYLKQSKAVAWAYLKAFAGVVPGVSFNESELSATFPNGAEVRLFGADNPDALRGAYFDGVVLDEVADMRPQVWGEIVRPMLADRQGWCLFIGTPKGHNLFSELYHRALREQELHGSEWRADLRRARDTGAIPEAELEKLRREMTDAQWAQEMECDFAAAVTDVLLRLDAVLAAQGRTLHESAYQHAAKVLGVDVARYGDDRTVLFPRQGLAAFQPKVFRNLDTMEVASQVAMAADRWQPDAVFVDLGAMGAGVADRLRQLGVRVIGVNFGGKPRQPRFRNKRAEMWSDMAEWVLAGGCLPEVEGLAGELTAPTFSYANAAGLFELESKDDMRERGLPSPDAGDALALTFAEPVVPRAHRERFGNQGRRALTDFDPYAERSA